MTSRVCSALLLLLTLACGAQSRTENRQERLDIFRSALPEDVREAFDGIEDESDCDSVAEALTHARLEDPSLQASIDSIKHAELIDTFSDRDLIYFFWYYFDYAIEAGSVPEP